TVEELAASLPDRWTFDVDISGVDDPEHLLDHVPGVEACVRSEGRWRVHADHDVRTEVHDAVVDAGGRLRHLSRVGADLDAIYHEYFTQASEQPEEVAA